MAKLEAAIKDSQKLASELQTKVGAAIEKEDRYNQLIGRQAQIEYKLGLTKHQAYAQAAVE